MRSSGVVLHPDLCPPDPEETAEAYLLYHLPPDQARVFEDHYITCARCAGIVENTDTFIVAMRRAAERLRHDAGV